MRTSPVSPNLVLAALGAGLVLAGCVSLQPYDAIRTELPDERFVTAGGSQVYVEQWGQGEPVVLIHGFGGSSHNWQQVAEELGDRYRLVAPDLKGFGWSERPEDREAYSFDNQVQTVVEVMEELKIDRAHIIGHSYGGGIALWLAASNPQLVRSLTLVDSTFPGTEFGPGPQFPRAGPLTPVLVRGMLRRRFVRVALKKSYYEPEKVDEALVDDYLVRLRIEGVESAFRGLTARSARPNGVLNLEELEPPVLVVWGAEDPLIEPWVGQQFAASVPDGRFKLLAECGHTPMEEKPDEFVEVVEPFLRRHSSATAD